MVAGFVGRKHSSILEGCDVQGPSVRPISDRAVRTLAAYNLNLRDLEQMMGERGIAIDHTTINRWALGF